VDADRNFRQAVVGLVETEGNLNSGGDEQAQHCPTQTSIRCCRTLAKGQPGAEQDQAKHRVRGPGVEVLKQLGVQAVSRRTSVSGVGARPCGQDSHHDGDAKNAHQGRQEKTE